MNVWLTLFPATSYLFLVATQRPHHCTHTNWELLMKITCCLRRKKLVYTFASRACWCQNVWGAFQFWDTEDHYQSSHKCTSVVCISQKIINFLMQSFSKCCVAAVLISWFWSQKSIKSVINHFYCSFHKSWYWGWEAEWKQPPLASLKK